MSEKRIIDMVNSFQDSRKGLLADMPIISNVLQHRLNIISITLDIELGSQVNHSFLDGSILNLELYRGIEERWSHPKILSDLLQASQ